MRHEIIQAYIDQTVAGWCLQNRIDIKTYYYWFRKIRVKACESITLPRQTLNEKPVEFIKLQVDKPKPDTTATVIIHLPSAKIEVKDGVSQYTMEAVLLALKNVY